jgi:hypothetical protein
MGTSERNNGSVTLALEPVYTGNTKVTTDATEIERIASPDDLKKDRQDYGRIDAEVAKYTAAERIDISEEESRRLRRMIDKRVLPVMSMTFAFVSQTESTLTPGQSAPTSYKLWTKEPCLSPVSWAFKRIFTCMASSTVG